MQDTLKEIRTELRLSMNGVTSTSMREKGVVYKLNFGVSLPEVERIAAKFQPSGELAAALWKEDIREFKLLATLLQPSDSFSHEQAVQWVKDIPYLEIAEQGSRNLFWKLPEAEELAGELLLLSMSDYGRTVAFLIWSQLYRHGHRSGASWGKAFLVEAFRTLTHDPLRATWKEQQAALKALKNYGRQSVEQATDVLVLFDGFRESDAPERKEFYNELKFEFEYYH